MPYYDTQLIDKEIEDFGETVTVRSVSSTYNERGDPTETTADTTSVKAIINIMTQTDSLVKEGILRAGEIVFFFDSDEANISRGNRIQYNSTWYEIVEPLPGRIIGNQYVQLARVRKI